MLKVDSILPYHGFIVTLRFIEKTQIGFFHQLSLTPFIRFLLNSPKDFNTLIRIDTPESGRLNYKLGDCYRFTVYGLSGSENLLQQLIEQLQKLPDSALKNDKNMPFRRNCQLVSLHDAFCEQPINHFSELSAYHVEQLQEEIQLWQSQSQFSIRFLSPIRLLKDKQQRENLKGEERYCRQLTDCDANLINSRLQDNFADLLRRRGINDLPSRAETKGLTLTHNTHLFWLDAQYTDEKNKAHVIGGMTGEICFEIETSDSINWGLWILGQYTGFGQRTAFGWGRYQLQTTDKVISCRRASPAQSLLTQIADVDNLITAFKHIEDNAKKEVIKEDYETDAILLRLEKDIEQLINGEFDPPNLRGFIFDKIDGTPRALAFPPFRDRVLQRAVSQIIQPLLDAMQYSHSYGFRSGRSRLNARYAIQSAWREGYRWVYESDIEDFFDSVSWHCLQIRLQALWGDDPLVDAIINWMHAPVEYEGELINRKRGLPQGSPLSPLMANLILDDFDNDMQVAGFKLIRYADDFVVLCQSKQRAEQAHDAAVFSLQAHGLALNAEKTNISTMERGFHYLGYLFVNDMVIDSPRRLREKATAPQNPVISPYSWLALLEQRQAKALENLDNSKKEPTPKKIEEAPLSSESGERDERGLLLCITGQSCVLSTCEGRLNIDRHEKEIYSSPWQHLQAVLLFGLHHITTPALKSAMEFNVPVHFCSATGVYEGVVWNGQAADENYHLWLKQQQCFENSENALALAQQIVTARLHHIKETLRLRAKKSEVEKIKEIITKVPNAESLATLNGLEGSGARLYFSALKDIVPSEFNFSGRNRQPPQDPYNSLLSLGFTLLYSCVESVLRVDGLLPWCGFYHQPHGKHATLASDLMEPFRHIVERLALALLKRGELKLKDFYITKQGACYLNKEARNLYLSKLMEKFDMPIKAKDETEAKTLFEHVHQQNLSLIAWIENKGAFKVWRIR
jgi:group II intron reverse transcriptase/maturase/CRISPR-associated endonuclease Cas1